MDSIWAFVLAHQTMVSLGLYYVFSAFIGALPSPTATSSPLYQFFFTFANTLGANVMRARNTAVESSPNWAGAVQKHIESNTPAPDPAKP